MTRLIVLLATLSLLLAGSAAGELWLFEGTYELGGIGSPAPAGSAIGVATVNGSGGGAQVNTLAIPGGLVSLSTSVVPTFTTGFTKVIVNFTPASGTFSRTTSAAPLVGVLPVPGNIRVCLFLSCAIFSDLPLTSGGTRGVGIGGLPVTATILGTATLSIAGADWTGATTTISSTLSPVMSTGFGHGPASATSTSLATDGVVRLVTPVPVALSVGGGAPAIVPVFGGLTVHFLPEPGVLGLLISGALALALLGWRRRRSTSINAPGGQS